MKIKKHIYSLDPKIGYERRECDDGTYRDIHTIHILKDGFYYYSINGTDIELLKTQAEVAMNGWNNGISNLTIFGKFRYIFTGKK